MYGLTLTQFKVALEAYNYNLKDPNQVIFADDVERIFRLCGDEYFVEHNVATDPWELCIENPMWDNARKSGAIKVKKGTLIGGKPHGESKL